MAFSRDGDEIMVAERDKYHLVNGRTKQHTDLFPFDAENTHPITKRIGPSEVGHYYYSSSSSSSSFS